MTIYQECRQLFTLNTVASDVIAKCTTLRHHLLLLLCLQTSGNLVNKVVYELDTRQVLNAEMYTCSLEPVRKGALSRVYFTSWLTGFVSSSQTQSTKHEELAWEVRSLGVNMFESWCEEVRR